MCERREKEAGAIKRMPSSREMPYRGVIKRKPTVMKKSKGSSVVVVTMNTRAGGAAGLLGLIAMLLILDNAAANWW